MSFLKTRTRIVQLAIAMVALAAMTFGAVSVQADIAAPAAPHLHFNPATGAAVYDADNSGNVIAGALTAGDCATDAASGPLVPAGNGAFGGVMTCPTSATGLGSVIVLPTSPTAGIAVVAINGATTVVNVVIP